MIETIMVVAVSCILVSIAVPNLGNYIMQTRAKAYVHDLGYAIKYARSEAQKIASDVHLLARDGDFNLGACITTANDCNNAAGLIMVIDSPEGIATDFAVPRITFDNKGWRTNPPAGVVSMTVRPPCTTGLFNYDLEVNRTGITRIERRECW